MKSLFNLLLILCCLQNANSQSYKNGYYYTKEGAKIEGLIGFSRSTFSIFGSKKSKIYFKNNEGEKPIKLTADDISTFVMGTDSFATVYNIKVNSVSGEYAKDFAKVVIVGKVDLFIHMSASSDGMRDVEEDIYVLSKDGKIFLGLWNPKKQREELADFFSDSPDIQKRILNKEFDKDIPNLVLAYNGK